MATGTVKNWLPSTFDAGRARHHIDTLRTGETLDEGLETRGRLCVAEIIPGAGEFPPVDGIVEGFHQRCHIGPVVEILWIVGTRCALHEHDDGQRQDRFR